MWWVERLPFCTVRRRWGSLGVGQAPQHRRSRPFVPPRSKAKPGSFFHHRSWSSGPSKPSPKFLIQWSGSPIGISGGMFACLCKHLVQGDLRLLGTGASILGYKLKFQNCSQPGFCPSNVPLFTQHRVVLQKAVSQLQAQGIVIQVPDEERYQRFYLNMFKFPNKNMFKFPNKNRESNTFWTTNSLILFWKPENFIGNYENSYSGPSARGIPRINIKDTYLHFFLHTKATPCLQWRTITCIK